MDLPTHISRLRILRWPLLAALFLTPLLGCWAANTFSFSHLAGQVLIGLILGSIYALIALGYTLVYGVIKLINFAHGDIYMLGAFTGYYLLRFTIRWLNFSTHLSLIWCFVISSVVSAVICALLAMLMERLAYRPLRRSSRIAALITAVGVSFLLENLGIIVFGPNPKSYEPKTLEVYQVQLAAAPDFAGAQAIEIMDTAQRSFRLGRFTKPAYARVRVVTRDGVSAWSPVLSIEPDKPGGFVEARTDTAPAAGAAPRQSIVPVPVSSMGFVRQDEPGRTGVVLSWERAAAEDIRLNPVFSDAQGNLSVMQWSPQRAPETGPAGPPGAAASPAAADVIRVPVFSIVIITVTALLLWGLNLLIHRSRFGISMRALSFDMQAAKLMGVNTNRIIAQTFAIGGACAAVAGNMVGIYNQSIEPLMGILPGLKAFVAAVVGGIGSIPGAAAGGLIMGLSEALVKGYIAPQWSGLADAMAFAILIAVLLFKPSGVFGTTLREKV